MNITRDFAHADRYKYDFGLCSIKNGFAQVDTSQDAPYYGIWANPFKLIIFTYCEGDCTTEIAENVEEFVKAIQNLKAWHEDYGHKFYGIDPGFNEPLERQFQKIGLGHLLH